MGGIFLMLCTVSLPLAPKFSFLHSPITLPFGNINWFSASMGLFSFCFVYSFVLFLAHIEVTSCGTCLSLSD